MAINDAPIPPKTELVTDPPVPSHPAEPSRIEGFPIWIKLSAIAIGCLVVFSTITGSESVSLALRQARGERFLASGNFKAARQELGPVAAVYSRDLDLQLDLAEIDLGEGDMVSAYRLLRLLSNSRPDHSQAQTVDQLSRIFNEKLSKMPTSVKLRKLAYRGVRG